MCFERFIDLVSSQEIKWNPETLGGKQSGFNPQLQFFVAEALLRCFASFVEAEKRLQPSIYVGGGKPYGTLKSSATATGIGIGCPFVIGCVPKDKGSIYVDVG